MSQDTKTIDAYNFIDFLQASTEALKEGYEFDYTQNSTAPQNLGFRYFAVMTKSTSGTKEKQAPEKESEQNQQKDNDEKPQTQGQRGRKPNSAK